MKLHPRVSLCRAAIFALAYLALGCSLRAHDPIRTDTVAVPASAPNPDLIGRDDVLDILVWKQKDLSGPAVVSSAGMITMPLLGEVPAAGLTTQQLTRSLTERLSAYVRDPNVTVRIADPKSRIFYVNGEVTHPGAFALHSGEVLSQAIAEAGGLTSFADPSAIRVIRRNGSQLHQMTVDYRVVQNGVNPGADLPLESGDTVMVP